MAMVAQHHLQEYKELSIYTTEVNNKHKMFALIQNNLVVGAYMSESLEQAQKDNAESLVIEVNADNSPWFVGSEYIEKNNI